jgi:sporulation protein YlmC with PRC-barrel domain
VQALDPADDWRGQSARKLIGSELRNRSGDHLGEIADVVIDAATGAIEYALVGSRGVPGDKGGAVRAVPFWAFDPRRDGSVSLLLDLNRATWGIAPTIGDGDIDTLGQERTAREISAFYAHNLRNDFAPAQARSGNGRLLRVTSVIGRQLLNHGRQVGRVEDVVLYTGKRQASILLDPVDTHAGTSQKFLVAFERLQPEGEEFKVALSASDFSRTTSGEDAATRRDRPVAWEGYDVPAEPDFIAAPVGVGADNSAATIAQEADPPDGLPSLAQVRGRFRGHAALSKNARDVTITRNGDRLIIGGTVHSEAIKKDVSKTIAEIAGGWKIDNQLLVQDAAE